MEYSPSYATWGLLEECDYGKREGERVLVS